MSLKKLRLIDDRMYLLVPDRVYNEIIYEIETLYKETGIKDFKGRLVVNDISAFKFGISVITNIPNGAKMTLNQIAKEFPQSIVLDLYALSEFKEKVYSTCAQIPLEEIIKADDHLEFVESFDFDLMQKILGIKLSENEQKYISQLTDSIPSQTSFCIRALVSVEKTEPIVEMVNEYCELITHASYEVVLAQLGTLYDILSENGYWIRNI